ncbi:hypothetical protein EJ04DRAFT_553009 [Polyplosphaeria fusca]|uniref:Heterokaryon incompatibility domain-containing protein n=1 Tax=Polyplosphaeria fusca TaxID=682080 RepID=A0A9P4V0W7_9PLEO|nr:hypothetical protein EJ04DRAFT_553009 [Polyplosphaeria fusca]
MELRPQAPHTCVHCQGIQIKRPSPAEVEECRKHMTLPPFLSLYGREVLRLSSCCLFFSWAMTSFRKKHKDEEVRDGWILFGRLVPSRIFHDPIIMFEWETKSLLKPVISMANLLVLSYSGSTASHFFPYPIEDRNISSDREFDLLREWTHSCHASHSKCNAFKSAFMPSRLLAITASESVAPRVKLVNNPKCADYAALSYCWGGDQKLKSCTNNVRDLEKGINFEDLPKTIQDAITTCLKLNTRFLWVDALCIVQDDPIGTMDDIANMDKVYENSCFTICDGRSWSSKQGFLHNITRPTVSETAFQFSYHDSGRGSGSIVCYVDALDRDYRDPIERRAWPLQEFLLSTRILRFGDYQRSWLCLESDLNDSNSPLPGSSQGLHRMRVDLHRQYYKTTKATYTTSKEPGIRSNLVIDYYSENTLTWRNLVVDYSRRQLSDERDKLLALSGIATRLGRALQWTYLAGLWREDFAQSMSWEVRPNARLPRSKVWRAPSWTWASVNSPVWFRFMAQESPFLKLLTHDLQLVTPAAPFGALKSGSITVQGLIRETHAYTKNNAIALCESKSNEQPVRTLSSTQVMLDTQDDYSEDVHQVYCLVVGHAFEDATSKSVTVVGILLVKETGGGFGRIGYFRDPVGGPEWSGSCKLKTVTII